MSDKTGRDTAEWIAAKRTALVLRILRGEISIAQAAHDYHLPLTELEAWKEDFLATAEAAVRSPPNRDEPTEPKPPGKPSGVWICANGRDSLAPCLFMEAACAGRLPIQTRARWIGQGDAPRRFRQSGGLPLLQGICSEDLTESRPLHLFANMAGAAVRFERRSRLADWAMPIPIVAMVMLLDKREEAGWFGQLLLGPGISRNRTLAWVQTQTLPLVVAAMGYETDELFSGRFALRYPLPAQVCLLAGEPPARRPLDEGDRTSAGSWLVHGSMATLLGLGGLRFNPQYASRILAVLRNQIREKEGSD